MAAFYRPCQAIPAEAGFNFPSCGAGWRQASCKDIVSPFGDLLSLVCARESRQREAHPWRVAPSLRYGVPCWCSLPEGGCGTRPAFGRAQTVLAESPLGQLRSSAPLKGAPKALRQPMVCMSQQPIHRRCAFGVPLGAAEKRSSSRGSPRGLSEPSRSEGEFRSGLDERASQGSHGAARRDRRNGGRFSLVTFFGEAKKVTRPRGRKGKTQGEKSPGAAAPRPPPLTRG